jgi:hypothetical protein
MAPFRRPPFWTRLFQNLPPSPPREFAALMCHSSGKLVGRRGLPEETGVHRRWLSWIAAVLTALGMVLMFSKLAWAETPGRGRGASIVVLGA